MRQNLKLGLIIFTLILGLGTIAWGAEKKAPYEVIGTAPAKHSLDKVVVEEFMNFGCPHCNHFHEMSEKIRLDYAYRVEFVTIPILFRGQNDAPLRLFYIAQSLGQGEKVKAEILKVKFKHGVDVFDPGVVNYMARSLGLSEQYQKEAKQDWVTEKIKESEQRATGFGINSTPTIVISGALKMQPQQSMEAFVESLPAVFDELLK
ncbi:MAG: thioredoxin domain-containing protein [SAR324 cluster bacterium]|nr:thioredoxin domain-containing protein [SAR324 cluster bacterium]